jgi:hypothetical protein
MPPAKSKSRTKRTSTKAAKRTVARKPAVRRAAPAKAVRGKKPALGSPVKLCPYCQTPNPLTQTKCINCGAKLPAKIVPAPKPVKGIVKPIVVAKPAKDRRIALLLEILLPLIGLLGLVWYFTAESHPILALVVLFIGLFGIGWLYAGNLQMGLILVVGMTVWNVFSVFAGNYTGGLTPYITGVVNVLVLIISIIALNGFMHKHPDEFGFY